MKKTSKIIMLAIVFLAVIAFVANPLINILGMGNDSRSMSDAEQTIVTSLFFDADSAYSYCEKQCEFGSRTMNGEAHDKCGQWIEDKFKSFGLQVSTQEATLKGYDGTPLKSKNIIATLNPDAPTHIMFCAHWDSRPWADNDPDEANHRTPVMGANDGASGVAVMLELARILKADSAMSNICVDFVCFDAEDWGTPQWADNEDDADTWALGAQHWAKEYAAGGATTGSAIQFAILLDMVGGEGARFYQEGMSLRYAPDLVARLWQSARTAGYSSYFPAKAGGYVTDDHVPVNEIAGVKCIDVITYHPDCSASSFGPTWHTINDTMEHISVPTLKAVGQTLAQFVSEL